ncbi:MAG: DNA polymerase III subunit epsilon [Geminicoccaceae bacterium]
MREIVLDTETTGLDPDQGHRVVEIAAVELVNHIPTGKHFHVYVNPERDMPEEAFRIHGLSAEFLAEHPAFAIMADEMLEFVGDSRLVIHNAAFDMRFLNAELKRLGREAWHASKALCTLQLAQRKFPGAPASLDALCKRFSVDNSARQLHGALLDCQLLAEVYLHLLGGRQTDLGLTAQRASAVMGAIAARTPRAPRPHAPSAEELAAHAAFVAKLDDPIWLQ